MTPTLWIALVVVATVALGYVLCLRVLARNSREIDKQVDYSRMRPWKDDEGDD